MTLTLSRTRKLKLQRSGCVIIAKIMHNDGTGITLGYRALMKLMTAGKFVAEAKEALLDAAEREKLFLEGATPMQSSKRKLEYDLEVFEGAEDRIPSSGTPVATQQMPYLEDSQVFYITDEEEDNNMDL